MVVFVVVVAATRGDLLSYHLPTDVLSSHL